MFLFILRVRLRLSAELPNFGLPCRRRYGSCFRKNPGHEVTRDPLRNQTRTATGETHPDPEKSRGISPSYTPTFLEAERYASENQVFPWSVLQKTAHEHWTRSSEVRGTLGQLPHTASRQASGKREARKKIGKFVSPTNPHHSSIFSSKPVTVMASLLMFG